MTSTLPKPCVVIHIIESLRPSSETRYLVMLARGLREQGVTTWLLSPDRDSSELLNDEERKRLQVFPGMLSGLARPFGFRRLAQWARELEPSLIHGLSAFTSPVCQRLSKLLDIPYVLSVHHYQERGGLRVGARCAKVLASSEAIRENLTNRVRLPGRLVEVVPLGLALPERGVPDAGDSGRYPVVLSFAALTPRQEVSTLLRAARKILDVRCGGCQFLVVGEGPEEPQLRRLTRELDLVKHVTYAHLNVPHERLLEDAAVYVQTPREQGFGAAVLEAMAWGLPVVATSVGGLIPLVREGVTGYLIKPGDHEALAERTLEILQDDATRRRFGENARLWVGERFSYRQMLEHTAAVYATVLGEHEIQKQTGSLQKA